MENIPQQTKPNHYAYLMWMWYLYTRQSIRKCSRESDFSEIKWYV